MPVAPGTWGSLAGLLVWLVLEPLPLYGQAILILLTAAAGTWAAQQMATFSGKSDPSVVVIDEVVGIWIALAGASTGNLHLAAAFLFFRLFDIWKPGPIDRLQRLPGGWGIMLDDLAAGALAWPLVYGLGLLV